MKKFHSFIYLIKFLVCCIILFTGGITLASDTIYIDSLGDGQTLDGLWKFHNGDERVATGNFEYIPSEFVQNDLSNEFSGIGWFSKTLIVNDSLLGLPAAFSLDTKGGAAEIFLNHKKIKSYGRPSEHKEKEISKLPVLAEFFAFQLDTTNIQLLEVRLSNHEVNKVNGFELSISNIEEATTSFVMSMVISVASPSFIIGTLLVFALIHLLLFFFYKEDKANLFYGTGMAILSFDMFLSVLSILSDDPYQAWLYTQSGKTLGYMATYFLLRFLYATFYKKAPFWHYGFLLFAIVSAVISWIPSIKIGGLFYIYITVWILELARVTISAIRFKKPGSRNIGIGIIAMISGILIMTLCIVLLTSFSTNEEGMVNVKVDSTTIGLMIVIFIAILLVIYGVPISMSLYTSMKSGATNEYLQIQLSKVEELSAETIKQEREKQRILENQKQMLESEVEQQTRNLRLQKEEIEEKSKEITDSIIYAKRIQEAILPPTKLVKENLPNSFILYKPKDIVAGDFYWLEPVGDTVIFAAADCTGHGVPGAMVSVVCSNALNRSVREFGLTEPAKILDKTLKIVIERFEKSEEEVKDGMDIALCTLNTKTKELQYAGANNPLWIISKDGELTETKATKQPIGKYSDPKPYENHEFQLSQGDSIYLFSDGFPDQFGGEKGKKLKTRAFKELLLSIQDQSMDAQRKVIDDYFETWRGDNEQIDDVCVIGVKLI